MTDEFLDEEEDEQEERTVTLKRSQIRELEQAAKAGRKAQEKLAQFERKNAFVEAGIPTSDKRADYFIKGYEGEVSPDAIKAEWDATFGQSPEQADPQEVAAHRRVSEASTGAEPPKTTLTPDDLARADSPEALMQMVNEMGLSATRE